MSAPPVPAVRVHVPAGEAELAADALWVAGAAAIEERPGELVAAGLAGDDAAPPRLLAAVARRWPAEIVAVDLEGALDAWRAHARPVVTRRLVVRPPWVAAPAPAAPPRTAVRPAGVPNAPGSVDGGPVEVVVDPGRAFGHGAHPSTRLILEAVDGLVRGGERVLDVGCGSGVLALAALALGAASARCVDTDPAARRATLDNAARNGVADRVTIVDHLAGPAVVADLVLANLLLPDHGVVAGAVAGALAPGGAAVVSGILTGQRHALAEIYGDEGLVVTAERAADGWAALTLAAR